jgi:hypothetical protein
MAACGPSPAVGSANRDQSGRGADVYLASLRIRNACKTKPSGLVFSRVRSTNPRTRNAAATLIDLSAERENRRLTAVPKLQHASAA